MGRLTGNLVALTAIVWVVAVLVVALTRFDAATAVRASTYEIVPAATPDVYCWGYDDQGQCYDD